MFLFICAFSPYINKEQLYWSRQVDRDYDFLEHEKIMDYNLLVCTLNQTERRLWLMPEVCLENSKHLSKNNHFFIYTLHTMFTAFLQVVLTMIWTHCFQEDTLISDETWFFIFMNDFSSLQLHMLLVEDTFTNSSVRARTIACICYSIFIFLFTLQFRYDVWLLEPSGR